MISADVGLTGDTVKNAVDGTQKFPVLKYDVTADVTELDTYGTSAFEASVIGAVWSFASGQCARVVGRSGGPYDITTGLGLTDVGLADTRLISNEDRDPNSGSINVKNVNDIWIVVLQDGVAEFVFHANYQPALSGLEELA